jgi:rare lipoprotein A
VLFALMLLSACGHKKVAHAPVPPPPQASTPDNSEPAATEAPPPEPKAEVVPRKTKPIYVETGMASWYGPPYHNRRGSNGEVYNMYALTAAHRTLPLNTMARITNLETGHSAMVRITDRGPFVEGRILDLSLAAAKQVDVWSAGVAKVKLEVMETPSPIDHGGRWCVQIGVFNSKKQAGKFKVKLQRRYRTADVLQFTGPTGEWIRVRVTNDEKKRAESLLHEAHPPEGSVFLVRLD